MLQMAAELQIHASAAEVEAILNGQAIEEDQSELGVRKESCRVRIRVARCVGRGVDFKAHHSKTVDGCGLCPFKGSGKVLTSHVYEHFTSYFCRCGHQEASKALIIKHIYSAQESGLMDHQDITTCYLVDPNHFEGFRKCFNLGDEVSFGPLLAGSMSVTSVTCSRPVSPLTDAPANRDIRLTCTPQQIQQDARATLQERALKRGQPSEGKHSRPVRVTLRGGHRQVLATPHSANRQPPAARSSQSNSNHQSLAVRSSPSNHNEETLKAEVAELRKLNDELRSRNQSLEASLLHAQRVVRQVNVHVAELQNAPRHISAIQAALDMLN